MNKFIEHMLVEARERYNTRWDGNHAHLLGLDTPNSLKCPFCVVDERERWIIFKASSFSAEVPTCSLCPLLTVADPKYVLEHCVAVGIKLLEKWEGYFDGEDSSW